MSIININSNVKEHIHSYTKQIKGIENNIPLQNEVAEVIADYIKQDYNLSLNYNLLEINNCLISYNNYWPHWELDTPTGSFYFKQFKDALDDAIRH